MATLYSLSTLNKAVVSFISIHCETLYKPELFYFLRPVNIPLLIYRLRPVTISSTFNIGIWTCKYEYIKVTGREHGCLFVPVIGIHFK